MPQAAVRKSAISITSGGDAEAGCRYFRRFEGKFVFGLVVFCYYGSYFVDVCLRVRDPLLVVVCVLSLEEKNVALVKVC